MSEILEVNPNSIGQAIAEPRHARSCRNCCPDRR
jgi:hypothetical protein